MNNKKNILLRLEIEGFHHYPIAPDVVSFLSDRHRHTFIITLCVHVNHLNRDKEIFIEREKISRHLKTNYGEPCEFGARSCEMIADELLGSVEDAIWCEVWEENTGGARVEK